MQQQFLLLMHTGHRFEAGADLRGLGGPDRRHGDQDDDGGHGQVQAAVARRDRVRLPQGHRPLQTG